VVICILIKVQEYCFFSSPVCSVYNMALLYSFASCPHYNVDSFSDELDFNIVCASLTL